MDSDRFDALARDVWQSQTRRRLVGRLAVAPLLGAIATLLTDPDEGGAAQPLQLRMERKRQPARRRRGHRRKVDRRERRRDNGQGGGDHPPGARGTCEALDRACTIDVTKPDPCCPPTKCKATIGIIYTTCQFGCNTDSYCHYWIGPHTECREDPVNCPTQDGNKCCRRKVCHKASDCPEGAPCCQVGCCTPDERCVGVFCEPRECGELLQPCCSHDSCKVGTCDEDHFCRDCGIPDTPCCLSNSCKVGDCVNGMCQW